MRGGLSGTSTMDASLDCDISAYGEMKPRGSLAAALTVLHSEQKLPLGLAAAREQFFALAKKMDRVIGLITCRSYKQTLLPDCRTQSNADVCTVANDINTVQMLCKAMFY